MPKIDLSMLNQRQTPAFYADVLANRPAAGFIGRIFVSTNTYAFYRDNGTGWDLIGGPGTGTVTGSGTAGQVTYWDGASSITGSNNLFWDSAAGHLGINTNTPGTGLDVHDTTSTILQLNTTTATNDTRIAFQNSGTSLWRIGNFYNAGANDWGIYDVVGAAQPLTIKKTSGQVLIGTSTVGSGKLVVASASSDNGIQIVGASAPSLRIDSAESGPTKRAGLGISTASNNFIQGSADQDFCIFNGTTVSASPILFGIYDAGAVNVQEAARISAARNFLVGTKVDSGQKLIVNGTALISNSLLLGQTGVTNAVINSNDGMYFNIDADASGGSPEFMFGKQRSGAGSGGTTLMTITNAGNVGINTTTPIERLTNNGLLAINGASVTSYYVGNNNSAFIDFNAGDMRIGSQSSAGNSTIQFYTTSGGYTNISERARISSSGNLLIGTTTDDGNKFQVNGSSYITGVTNIGVVNNGIHQLGVYVSGGANRNMFQVAVNGVSNGFRVRFDNATSTVRISMTSLPTSAVGLSSGDVYSNAGILTIVP